jgi:exodeoxyribonuclease (lambda-induced)
MYDLAAQIVSGQSPETYTSAAMEEGIRREEESRKLYEMIYGVEVRQVGMIFPDEKKKYLCSPDGLRTDEIGLELKNVLPKTQVEYLLSKKLPSIYIPQVQGSMLVTGFKQWHFMSYCPSLPPLILEIDRDEKWIEKCEKELTQFNEELLSTVEKLK